jgi:hypothetical protein
MVSNVVCQMVGEVVGSALQHETSSRVHALDRYLTPLINLINCLNNS